MSRIVGLFVAGAVAALVSLGSVAPAVAQAPAAPLPPDPACAALTEFVAATTPNLPQPIDDITEVTEMVVDCDARALIFVLRFLVPDAQLPPDALDATRGAFLVGTCQQGIAEATGWTLAGEFRAADGTVTARFDTTAADCVNIAATAPAAVADYVAVVAAAFPAPVRVDPTLEIVAATTEGTTLVLAVRLAGNYADAQAVATALGTQLLPILCTTEQIGALFRVGAFIRLSVVDDAGRETLSLPLDPPACEAAFAAATAAAGAAADVPAGPTPEEFCAAAAAAVAQMQPGLPTYGEDGTETVAITFDCPTATVTILQNYVGPADLYIGPALADQEMRHDVIHCSADGFAAALAVAVVTEVRSAEGNLLARLVTTPPDCDLVTAAMVAAALPVLSPEGLAARLAEIADTNRPALPIRLNEAVSLVSVFNSPTALVLFYQLEGNFQPAQLEAIGEQITAQMISGDCNDPSQLQLLRSGASITYRYSDTQSNGLFSVTVTAATCGIQ